MDMRKLIGGLLNKACNWVNLYSSLLVTVQPVSLENIGSLYSCLYSVFFLFLIRKNTSVTGCKSHLNSRCGLSTLALVLFYGFICEFSNSSLFRGLLCAKCEHLYLHKFTG